MVHTKIRLISILTLIFLCLTPAAISQDDTDTPFPVARLGRGTVQYIEWHPDGEFFAVQSGTGIWLYDIDFNTLAHYPELRSLTWNADGSLAFSLTDTDSQQIWHLNADFTRDIRLERPDIPYPAVWSPVANTLASIIDETIHIWDATTGDDLLTIPATISTRQVRWSPDGRYITGRYRGDVLWIWDISTGEQFQTVSSEGLDFGEDSFFLQDFEWIDNQHISAAGYFGEEIIWDVVSGEPIYHLAVCEVRFCERSRSEQVAFSPDRRLRAEVIDFHDMIYSVYSRVTDSETHEEVGVSAEFGPERSFERVYWHPNSQILTATSPAGLIQHWNLYTGEFSEPFTGHIPLHRNLSWSPDGTRLVAWSGNEYETSYGQIWDVAFFPDTYHLLGIFDIFGGDITFYWSDDSRELTTVTEIRLRYWGNFQVARWDTDTGALTEIVWEQFYDYSVLIYGVVWNNERSQIAISEEWFTLRVEDVEGRVVWEIMSEYPNTLWIDDWNPTTNQLLVHTYDQEQSIAGWQIRDAATGQVLGDYTGNTPRDTYWHNDGETLIVRRWNGDADQIVDFESNTLLPVPETWFGYDHPDWFSSSGLYAEIESSRVTLYDGTTREFIIEIDEPVGVFSLAWHPNGQYLALGLGDGTIRIWDVSPLLEE